MGVGLAVMMRAEARIAAAPDAAAALEALRAVEESAGCELAGGKHDNLLNDVFSDELLMEGFDATELASMRARQRGATCCGGQSASSRHASSSSARPEWSRPPRQSTASA